MKYKILIVFLILVSKSYAKIIDFEGKITKVVDGDTLVVNGDIKIRMACVDAYESSINKHLKYQVEKLNISQEEILKLGLQQKKALKLYENKRVRVFFDTNNKLDKYNRLLGVVVFEENNSFDVLNKGLKYYNNTFLCKQFLLD